MSNYRKNEEVIENIMKLNVEENDLSDDGEDIESLFNLFSNNTDHITKSTLKHALLLLNVNNSEDIERIFKVYGEEIDKETFIKIFKMIKDNKLIKELNY